jgi:D-glycerate 3-kinase
VSPDLSDLLAQLRLPDSYGETIDSVCRPLAERIVGWRAVAGRSVIVGLCGPQGSGKSTLCVVLAALIKTRGLNIAVLGIDDLYLPKARRSAMAAAIHPLFATRGPPGTHDVALALRLFDALTNAAPAHTIRLPVFDKAADDRVAETLWPETVAPVDVLLFEGWCVGARPQGAASLAKPLNELEAQEDPDGRWRALVEAALAGPYQTLFARLNHLILLRPPSFETVHAWRAEQEEKLAKRLAETPGASGRAMSEGELRRFIQHYERLTRHMMAGGPKIADLVIEFDADRRPLTLSEPRS